MITPKELKETGYIILCHEYPIKGEMFFPVLDQESRTAEDFTNNNYELDYNNIYDYTTTENYEMTIINKNKEGYVAISPNNLEFMLNSYNTIDELITELYEQYRKKDTLMTLDIKKKL